MKLTIGLQQTIVTVKQVKNRQRSDFVGQNVFVFLLLQTLKHKQRHHVQWRRQDLRTGRACSRAYSSMVGPQTI